MQDFIQKIYTYIIPRFFLKIDNTLVPSAIPSQGALATLKDSADGFWYVAGVPVNAIKQENIQ